MSLSNYSENKFLDHILRNSTWTKPASVYVSMHTSAPSETGTPSNEVSAAWYARQQPAVGWNAGTTSGITNNGIVQWGTVTGSSVTVSHIGLYDALTSGNLLWYGALASSRLFGVGSAPFIGSGNMSVTISGMFSNYLIPLACEQVVGKTQLVAITAAWLAMYTSNPTAADSGTEVSGGSYARQQIEFDAASNGATQNTNTETFPTATANLGTITHLGLRSASVGGNLLFFGAWTSGLTVNNGDTYKVNSGDLDISLD